jgi:hypothetical protein
MWYAPRGNDQVFIPPAWVGYDNAIKILRTRGKL